MIPHSTTITEEGRRARERLLWGVAVLVTLVALAIAFAFLDRSTVVDGPTGSSFVTTATGLAALHDTLERDGREPVRIRQPVSPGALASLDAYLVSDVEFGRFTEAELDLLTAFVNGGGTAVVLGVPPTSILDTFEVELDWSGESVGEGTVTGPLFEHTNSVVGERFGSFDPAHLGETLAASPSRDLAVRFVRGGGSVVFVADSSLAHNATIVSADNVDFFGDLLGGRTAFDEFRHGFDDTSPGGLLSAAPGNWTGASILGAIVLALALVTYGRRFGTVEPHQRALVPDRSTFIDSVARSVRRAGGDIPSAPLRRAVIRELGLATDTTTDDIISAARRRGVDEDLLTALDSSGAAQTYAFDHTLATLATRSRH